MRALIKTKFIAVTAAMLITTLTLSSISVFAQDEEYFPPDVENLEATAGDSEVLLEWDSVEADPEITKYRVYYGEETVTAEGGEYTEEVDTDDSNNAFIVTDLDNDTTYFFTVTAMDGEGNESFNYALEVSATPREGLSLDTDGLFPSSNEDEDDGEAPKVVSAEATDKNTVEVVMSEAIELPTVENDAFSIVDTVSEEDLRIEDVELDSSDDKKVVITTEDQDSEAEYLLTASSEVEDKFGNPVISGTSDSASFFGSALDSDNGSGNTDEDPRVDDAIATSSTTVVVTFNEPIVLGSTPTDNFKIEDEDGNDLTVINAQLNTDGTAVSLTTTAQSDATYTVTVSGVEDDDGNSIDSDSNSTTFNGIGGAGSTTPPANDEDAPNDATDFVAKLKDTMVNLTWSINPETAGELANQLLYKSNDLGKTYTLISTLDAEKEAYDVKDLTEGKHYFKLTAKNDEGDESAGVITSITLPETGMGLGLLLMGSMGLSGVITRRRK